jgi:threonine dehydratase
LTRLVGLDDVSAARKRLAGLLRPTPVERSEALSRLLGRPVLLKPEQRQRTGSFKIRGAYNHIAQLPASVPVVAASAGNHAQGVALAAMSTGHPSTIFMPRNASIPKIQATRGYGATVLLEGETVDECIALARQHAEESCSAYVPPFDDLEVIAGQATIGAELLEEAPGSPTVLVPVGGGGLIAGVAAAMVLGSTTGPGSAGPRVVGVEAAGAPTMTAALEAGHPVALERMSTMADGIAVGTCSELTLAHARRFVDEMVTVGEEEISEAMLLLLERAKSVVEPAGAVSLASVISGKVGGSGPVVAVLSGGNVDPLLLTKLVVHGLTAAGRYLTLRVVIADRVGALAYLTGELARLRLNVIDVEHHRGRPSLGLDEVEVHVTVETRDSQHHEEVLRALATAGLFAEPVV